MLAAWKRFDLGAGGYGFRHVPHECPRCLRSVLDREEGRGSVGETESPHTAVRNVRGHSMDPMPRRFNLTFYWDYSPWISYEISPQASNSFTFVNRVFAYASKPIIDGGSALAMGPVAGEFPLTNRAVRLKLTPSADGSKIQRASEERK